MFRKKYYNKKMRHEETKLNGKSKTAVKEKPSPSQSQSNVVVTTTKTINTAATGLTPKQYHNNNTTTAMPLQHCIHQQHKL
jgi:hypothetical protein